MDKLKYIIIDGIHPILFGPTLSHAQVAAPVSRELWKPVTSAGFAQLFRDPDLLDVRVRVFGKSTSLNDLGPAPGDAALIAHLFDD